MPTLLTLSLILLLTKTTDIVTTVRGIRRGGGSVAWERSPFARRAMRRWGLGGGITCIMGLWCVVVATCYVPAFFVPPGNQRLPRQAGSSSPGRSGMWPA